MDGLDVKYRELIRRLRRIASDNGSTLTFVREGSNHELWEIDGERLVIPRHREINEHTVRAIVNQAREVTRREDS